MKKQTTTSLKINHCSSKKANDSEDGKLQLKTVHQTSPSVMEQSLNTSFFDPSFFRHISQFIYFIFSVLPLDEDTKLICQKVCFGKMFLKDSGKFTFSDKNIYFHF